MKEKKQKPTYTKINYKDYLITLESGFTIHKKGVNEKGKNKTEILGYFTSIGNVIKEIVEDDLKNRGQQMELGEYLKEYKALSDELISMVAIPTLKP